VLGPRGDNQEYAGPDFEALEYLVSSYGPALEAARRSTLDAQYAALVMKLFQGMPQKTMNQYSLEDVSYVVAKAIALATVSCTEIWLADEEDGQQVVRPAVRIGTGPLLLAGERVAIDQLRDGGRVACFVSWPGTPHWFDHIPVKKQDECAGNPEGEAPQHAFPFAWLPLLHGDHMAGVIILTYPQPHVFSLREQRLLQLCVQQYAGLFKQAQIIHQLQAASVQQHEQELLQERVALDAATALYRPLSRFEGYVDLLHTSGQLLSLDGQHDCFDRAERAVADLLLRVNEMIVSVSIEQQHVSDAQERE
jgi:GAF domain-containing protein